MLSGGPHQGRGSQSRPDDGTPRLAGHERGVGPDAPSQSGRATVRARAAGGPRRRGRPLPRHRQLVWFPAPRGRSGSRLGHFVSFRFVSGCPPTPRRDETKRNETKRNETKRNETKRKETKRKNGRKTSREQEK